MAVRLALPITITAGGRLSGVELGSDADLAQSVALLAATRPGERRAVPEYGVEAGLGGAVDVDGIRAAIVDFEPRVDPVSVTLVGRLEHGQQRVQITRTGVQ